MAEQETVDVVVNERPAAPRSAGRAGRPIHVENIAGDGVTRVLHSDVEDESQPDARRAGRKFNKSTEDLLAKFEAEEKAGLQAHEEGDADEDEPDEVVADEGDADEGDADEGDADEGDADEGDSEEEDDDQDDSEGDEVEQIRATAARLEERNKALVAELETARKTPKAQRSDREQSLLDAEAAYIDEGSVPAMRKFLSVITGTAPDSKEVDAELAGLYLDLTEREVGVPLDENQRSKRDNARTRMLLARDKREKAEGSKKPAAGNGADDVQYEAATRHVDNLLGTKTQSGTSLADEYPMLMSLAQDFDRLAPGEVVARAIRQEILAGTLDANTPDTDLVRTVASKIESYYDGVAKKIEAARSKKKTKPDTTTPSAKPKVKVEADTETRNKPPARTITTATASRAPAKNPKATKQKAPATGEKTRKDFKNDAAWKEHLLSKHFKQ